MSRRSSIFKKITRKKLLRCNQREAPCLSDNVPKKLQKPKEEGTDFLSRLFSTNSCPVPVRPTTKIREGPCLRVVRRFVALLRPGWHLYTFEKLKRGVGAFVRSCRGERFCSLKPQGQRREAPGGWEIASLPAAFSASDSARFLLIRLRQNAQGEGSAEGSKKEQDKRRASQVTPARVTSSRSAGRFKDFRALGRGRMRGPHLNLGAHV